MQIWKQKGGWHILHCMYLSSYNDSCMKSGDSISHILRFQDEKIFLQIKHNLHTHLYTRTHTQAKIDKERNANALNTTIIDFAFIFNVRYVYV